MGRNGFLIGEVAARSGMSRKAVRLYEAAGILPPPRRTAAGYRLYGPAALGVLGFVARARRLGFTLREIREIVGLRRAGRRPCAHVRMLVARKVAELDAARRTLRAVLASGSAKPVATAVVCPHIERSLTTSQRGGNDGQARILALPQLHRLPRGRPRRRAGPDR